MCPDHTPSFERHGRTSSLLWCVTTETNQVTGETFCHVNTWTCFGFSLLRTSSPDGTKLPEVSCFLLLHPDAHVTSHAQHGTNKFGVDAKVAWS